MMAFGLVITSPVFAQVVLKTGAIYGKVVDANGIALSGVSITLESDVIPSQSATTGAGGAFRFANLPPGTYAATFFLQGFTEVKQEELRVTVGGYIELHIILPATPAEQVQVVSETPLVEKTKTGTDSTYTREHLQEIPGGRDPWFIIDQTPGVESDRYNVAGSESGNQPLFFARGGSFWSTVWNYDGVNIFTPSASPVYYDFDAFEEMEITTGGNDASVYTGGIVVNIVAKRGGNEWVGNASYYNVSDALQSTNTPQELIDHPILNPITGEPAKGSNRTEEINEYGLDIGGPLIKDKLFVWGAYRQNWINLFSITDLPDNTKLTNYNFKTNFNWNTANESQFGYFRSSKDKIGRGNPAIQAPETLWNQGSSNTLSLPGIVTAQQTWVPNDHTIVTGRFGYIGADFSLIPPGGNDKPMIFLSAIPHWENTWYFESPVLSQEHDINADVNSFKQGWMGGDHEFKFGFEYRTSWFRTFISYGNGVYIYDYYQTTPGGPLTSGYVQAQHYEDGRLSQHRVSLYATDTYRKDRLTLNLGFNFATQTAKNEPSSVPAVPGFEQFVGPFDYPGGDPGITFRGISPRLGASYDVAGNGKTIVRANFARYYDAFDLTSVEYSNPTYVSNGVIFLYQNKNGDRTITPGELVGDPIYYGGLNGPVFDLDAFLAVHKYASDISSPWTNEVILAVEREVTGDLSVSATYTYRRYGNFTTIAPFGVSTSDYVPGGTYSATTPLGDFSVPYFVLPEGFKQDGTAIYTNIKDFNETYNGVDIVVRKRMSHNFQLNGSLTVQKQTGHYHGGDSLARDAYDPTNLPFVQGHAYAYMGKGGIYPYSEWNMKVSGVYQFPYDIQAAAYLRYQQGYPYIIYGNIPDSTLQAFNGTSSRRIMVEPVGSRRFDNKFILDLKFEKGFEIGHYGRLTGIVDLFNVTNSNTVLRRNAVIDTSTFNRILEVLSPRAARLGLRYSF